MLYLLYQEKERGDTMSANVYNVQSLLVGKEYRSNTLTGEIISAELHPKAVWYQGAEAYLVEVKSYDMGVSKYSYRTIAVALP